jgi:TRAP-type C4-dicarboxylate transport system substrate-binding protein
VKALAALTIVLVAAGCASGTKSGGTATHVIRIVMQTPDAPDADAEYFISQVKQRSRGRIEILEGSGYTSNNPSNESGLVRALRSGKVEMAYIPSRAWERASSVTAFRALQAPFLVTTYPLLRRITTGSIGRSMLRSLGSLGLVGLGLVPDELRRPLGRRPLDSPATLRGARIRVITSPDERARAEIARHRAGDEPHVA